MWLAFYYALIFQEALLKSNEVFETFKQEIEKVHDIGLFKNCMCSQAMFTDVYAVCMNFILKLSAFFSGNIQMTKSIKELKKENQFLKSKTEKSDITLIELVDEVDHLHLICMLVLHSVQLTIQSPRTALVSASFTYVLRVQANRIT